MPVLVRYCLLAIWPPFLISMGSILFILNLLFYSIPFLDYLFTYHVGLKDNLLLLIYFQPSFLILAIPMGFLFSVLWVYGRLSSDREVMAIEAAGHPVTIIIWPMILFSVLMSVFLVFFMDRILPWGNTSWSKLNSKVISENTNILLREKVFIKDFDGYILYIGENDNEKKLLRDVTVEFLDERKYPYRLVLSKEGLVKQDPANYHVILELHDGNMQQLGAGRKSGASEFMVMKFQNCDLDMSARKIRIGPGEFNDARNITIKELSDRIAQDKKEGKDYRRDETEFHKKFSIPFAALAFALIGVPLGLASRLGSVWGVFFAIVLVGVYDWFITMGDILGDDGKLPPLLAMWLPNLVLMAVGAILIYWLNHRTDFLAAPRQRIKGWRAREEGSPIHDGKDPL
jgi:LPS export ABC transporter permease LptF